MTPDSTPFSWEDILLGIGILIVSYLLQRLTSKILSKHLHKKVSHKMESSLKGIEEHVLEALSHPLRFIFIAGGLYIASEVVTFPQEYLHLKQQILHTVFIVFAFWCLIRLISPLSHIANRFGKTDEEKRFTEELRSFLVSILKGTLVLIGILSLLQNWGINVTTFLAGLGLIGMAVSFAAQESIKQFFGSLALILDRPFEDGDWIKVGDVEGVIESIGLRTTKMRLLDRSSATLPNSDLANAKIINKSDIQHWRVSWMLGLTYATTAEQLETIIAQIKAYLEQNKHVDVKNFKRFTMVALDKFNDSSIDIHCSFYTKAQHWNDYMLVKHECVLAFKKIVEEAGSSFAFPSQSIYVEGRPHFHVHAGGEEKPTPPTSSGTSYS